MAIGHETDQLIPLPALHKLVDGVVYVDVPFAIPQVAATGQLPNSLQVWALYLQDHTLAQESALRE